MTLSSIKRGTNLISNLGEAVGLKKLGAELKEAEQKQRQYPIGLAVDYTGALQKLEQRQKLGLSGELSESNGCEGKPQSQTASASSANKYDVKIQIIQQMTQGTKNTITELRSGGTRAWRNHNPGNIRSGSFANHHGAIGEAGGFAVFPDESTGQAAVLALLKTKSYQSLTIDEAVARYAPPVENNTASYQATLKQSTGLEGTSRLSSLSDAQLADVVKGIRAIEGWKVGEVSRTENCE